MTARVVLAGVGTPGVAQHHQRDMYAPAVDELEDAAVVAVLGTPQDERARDLAAGLGVPLQGPTALPEQVDLVISCPDVSRPDDLEALLSACAAHGAPVLLDKPTLLQPAVLDHLAARFPTVVPGHHPRVHRSVAAARARVVGGELGLLHALHGELVVGPVDGPHPQGELRNLAVYALDVVRSMVGGPLTGRAHAVQHPAGPDGAGEAWTISARLRPDVAVTLLVGRAGGSVQPTLHRYRLMGSHGHLLVDLDSPAVDVLGGTPDRLRFGPSSVAALVSATLTGTAGTTLVDAAGLGRVLLALETAAREHRVVDL